MIYLDNAATGGFKPESVLVAAGAALGTAANPGRSGHKLSLACLERVYDCRKLLCGFFNGYSYERVIFTKNCTEALNIAILGGLKGFDVLSTAAEHNSVLRPLKELARRGARVEFVGLDKTGHPDIDGIAAAVKRMKKSRARKAAVITLASNVTGKVTDIERVRQVLPPDWLLICDGAQACGHVPTDMKKCGIDALAVAGHKGMLAIQGSGALVFSERFEPGPIMFGGTGSESLSTDMPSFYPDRLESGTVNYPAIISLAEGVLYLEEHMREHMKKVLELTQKTCHSLADIPGVTLFSEGNFCGIVSFALKNMQSEEAAFALSEKFGICVRGGLHCAPYMHRALDSDGLVRASFSAFNSYSHADALSEAVSRLAKEKL